MQKHNTYNFNNKYHETTNGVINYKIGKCGYF